MANTMNKKTPFRAAQEKRNSEICERYNQLIAEGYMKTRALEIILDESDDFYSIQGVYIVLKKAGLIKPKPKKIVPPKRTMQ